MFGPDCLLRGNDIKRARGVGRHEEPHKGNCYCSLREKKEKDRVEVDNRCNPKRD